MKIFRVQRPEEFDAKPEFSMGLHIGMERTGPKRRGNRLESLFLVMNGFYAISIAAARAIGPVELEAAGNEERRENRQDSYPGVGHIRVGLHRFPERDVTPCEDVDLIASALEMSSWRAEQMRQAGHVHGSPAFSAVTHRGEKFVRFSAFQLDRRVTSLGGLLPGSYTTSAADARHVSTALTAIGRYALPSIQPPQYYFDVVAPALTPIYYGTVTPAFGQAGGGTEIEFYRGASDGSVSRPLMLPVY
jgi:hypothetical protein